MDKKISILETLKKEGQVLIKIIENIVTNFKLTILS